MRANPASASSMPLSAIAPLKVGEATPELTERGEQRVVRAEAQAYARC